MIRFVQAACLAFAVLGLGGCTIFDDLGSDSQESHASDLATAKQMVKLIGGKEGRCGRCHEMTADRYRAWGDQMQRVERECFQSSLSDAQRIRCLKTGDSPANGYGAQRLGFYSAGAEGDQFRKLFDQAIPAESHCTLKGK